MPEDVFHLTLEEAAAAIESRHALTEAVKDEAERIHSDLGLSGKPLVSYRVTQLYTTGVCVYSTYGAYTLGHDGAEVAIAADQRLRQAIVSAGGAISNHHGIGKFRSKLLHERLSAPNADIVRAMKHELDAKTSLVLPTVCSTLGNRRFSPW
jgi:alkyldihydroxyacetonephosphate synthase